jgi:hypothetical protein
MGLDGSHCITGRLYLGLISDLNHHPGLISVRDPYHSLQNWQGTLIVFTMALSRLMKGMAEEPGHEQLIKAEGGTSGKTG